MAEKHGRVSDRGYGISVGLKEDYTLLCGPFLANAVRSGLGLGMVPLPLFTKCREPDDIDDGSMNRVVWRSCTGISKAHPAKLSGAHGKGLKSLASKLDKMDRDST